jgi:acyl-CoA synthetase (AMP-forming)/AMP-acid ligase II
VAIRDAAGRCAAPGEAGELAIAGPGLLDAYLTPWQTRDGILDHGYFRTGDLAAMDSDGAVTLLGRLKDVINVGGVKVFPLEVESVLAAHPAVRGCRVAAATDPRLGEQVVAEVELAAPVEPDELAAWCADRLAPLKRPGRITVVDRLPRTGSGKIKR